ncbi:unnamed protein product, partial [Linum tenue]
KTTPLTLKTTFPSASTNPLPPTTTTTIQTSSPSSTTSTAAASASAPEPTPSATTAAAGSRRGSKPWWSRPTTGWLPRAGSPPRSKDRLPAAIEDGYTALKWLQGQALAEEPDTWLTDVADFGNVFISGDSAGGNIAHNLAVRVGAGSVELGPVVVKGYVLLAPFFGGTVLCESEANGPVDAFLNLELIDRFWRLSVPVGDTTDHPLINPFGPSSKDLEPVALDPVLVVVGGSDLLKDRAKVYAEKLTEMGKKIEYVEFEGQQHGFFTIDPEAEPAKKLMGVIKRFIAENSS